MDRFRKSERRFEQLHHKKCWLESIELRKGSSETEVMAFERRHLYRVGHPPGRFAKTGHPAERAANFDSRTQAHQTTETCRGFDHFHNKTRNPPAGAVAIQTELP